MAAAPTPDVDAIAALPTETCKKYLIDVIENQLHVQNYTYEVSAGSVKGDNYLGIVYRVRVLGERDSNGNTTEHSIIVKCAPQNDSRREQFNCTTVFFREDLMYTKYIPLMFTFQESKGIVPTENGFYEIPKCYRSCVEDHEEALYLEDLRALGFEMFDRHKAVTYEHVRLVMEALGKLHAVSFAIKDQAFEKLEPFTKMPDIFADQKDEQMKMWFDLMMNRALGVLDGEDDKEALEKMKTLASKPVLELFKDCVDASAAEPYATVCHGDCWNNNVLFKYENNIPNDLRLLDWQIARYSSPICDLAYYLYGCTTKKLRDLHYNDFLEIYYKSFSKLLTTLGSDPDKLFPHSAFMDQWKKFGKFGVIMATLVLPVFTSESDDVPDLDEMAERMQNKEEMDPTMFVAAKTEHIYRKRMRDVIYDAIDLKYI